MAEDDETHRAVAKSLSWRLSAALGAIGAALFATGASGRGVWPGPAAWWLAGGVGIGAVALFYVWGSMHQRRPPKAQIKERFAIVPQPGADKATWNVDTGAGTTAMRLIAHYTITNLSRDAARFSRVDILTIKGAPVAEGTLNLNSGAELQAEQTTTAWLSCRSNTLHAKKGKDFYARVVFTDEQDKKHARDHTFNSAEPVAPDA